MHSKVGFSILFTRMIDVFVHSLIFSQSPVSIQAEEDLNAMRLGHFPGQDRRSFARSRSRVGEWHHCLPHPREDQAGAKQIVMGNLTDLPRLLHAVS